MYSNKHDTGQIFLFSLYVENTTLQFAFPVFDKCGRIKDTLSPSTLIKLTSRRDSSPQRFADVNANKVTNFRVCCFKLEFVFSLKPFK